MAQGAFRGITYRNNADLAAWLARKPREAALPGMEDHAIRPLEDVAKRYAEIRDERMELTKEETQLKKSALALMKKYDKTIYRHAGITITVIQGEEDVKVRVQKADKDETVDVDTLLGAGIGSD